MLSRGSWELGRTVEPNVTVGTRHQRLLVKSHRSTSCHWRRRAGGGSSIEGNYWRSTSPSSLKMSRKWTKEEPRPTEGWWTRGTSSVWQQVVTIRFGGCGGVSSTIRFNRSLCRNFENTIDLDGILVWFFWKRKIQNNTAFNFIYLTVMYHFHV